ncbi:RGS domain-containing protein [Dimargaris cristalligena]|uniref:RGS domain-containing protein n=1 Tax=Dimargaris cristalligena TaxID=215637 RepID=A0A4P9ZZY2_9FUNG|nr:RGS domain-containing protein [Dimargaris cristalligena]|eukprot:RKP38711.1 RGS domain-containing protein [Dimargaris cristalligena]
MNPQSDPLLRQHSAALRSLPSLELVLSRKTCPPVCLYNFYVYLRDVELSEENLDFWLDVVAHENLCKTYCQNLIKTKASNAPLNYLKKTNMRWTVKNVTQELRYSTYSNSVGSEVRGGPPADPDQFTPDGPLLGPSDMEIDMLDTASVQGDDAVYCDHPYCTPGTNHTHFNYNPANITRQDLKKSAERIYYRYIVAGAEHELNMPELMRLRICRMIEMEQRDDPDVFLEAKNYVFNLMAHDAFPRFLYARAYENMGYTQTMLRLVVGLFSLLLGFTVELCLIFLDMEPKAQRWFGLIPIWFGFLNLFVNQEKLCPLFTLLGVSERGFCRFNRVRDHKVRGIHVRRAIIIAFTSLFIAVIVTLIFYLVPGHRL